MDEGTIGLVEDYLDGKLHVFDQDYAEIPLCPPGKNRLHGGLRGRTEPLHGGISFLWVCIPSKGVKVGLDCANGSWNIAKTIF